MERNGIASPSLHQWELPQWTSLSFKFLAFLTEQRLVFLFYKEPLCSEIHSERGDKRPKIQTHKCAWPETTNRPVLEKMCSLLKWFRLCFCNILDDYCSKASVVFCDNSTGFCSLQNIANALVNSISTTTLLRVVKRILCSAVPQMRHRQFLPACK